MLITGCSGGGKSSLLEELARRGYATMPEPGRRVVREQLASGGGALPWLDMDAFMAAATERALRDRAEAVHSPNWVFFDRGLVDTGVGVDLASSENRYNATVFVAPPWPALFIQDDERRHEWKDAVAEYGRIRHRLTQASYEVSLLPRIHIAQRADFVLHRLSLRDGA